MRRIAIFMALLAMLHPITANADVAFVRVLNQVVKVMIPALSGEIPVTIIYQDNEQLAISIRDTITANSTNLVPSITTLSSFDASKSKIAIIADKSLETFRSVFSTASQAGVLTVAMSRECVEQSLCVIYFDTSSGVKIVVNDSALSQTAGVSFRSAFLLLVERL